MRVVALGEGGLDRAGLTLFGGEHPRMLRPGDHRHGQCQAQRRRFRRIAHACDQHVRVVDLGLAVVGEQDAKCASGPMPNIAISNAGFSPNCSMSSRWYSAAASASTASVCSGRRRRSPRRRGYRPASHGCSPPACARFPQAHRTRPREPASRCGRRHRPPRSARRPTTRAHGSSPRHRSAGWRSSRRTHGCRRCRRSRRYPHVYDSARPADR